MAAVDEIKLFNKWYVINEYLNKYIYNNIDFYFFLFLEKKKLKLKKKSIEFVQ